jgi:hypothetical protein
MLYLWRQSYSTIRPIGSSALLSMVAHGVLITSAVIVTRRPATLEGEGIANRAYYLVPPDRPARSEQSTETLRYIELAPPGLGAGFGPISLEPERSEQALVPRSRGDMAADAYDAVRTPAVDGDDSVFTMLEVDSSVVRSAESLAPAFPLTMLRQGLEGAVYAQYVVDTSGFADTTSLRIIRSTHPDFAASVRDALPYMRFRPAKIGSGNVRQLVEQEFRFKIQQAAAIPDSQTKARRTP